MATTQLSETYALQKTKSGAVSSPDISEGKKYVSIIDQNSGSYTSGYIEIDASNQLVGSQGWAKLGDSYITVPVAITAKILTAVPSTPKQFGRFLVMPKANVTNWVDSVSVRRHLRCPSLFAYRPLFLDHLLSRAVQSTKIEKLDFIVDRPHPPRRRLVLAMLLRAVCFFTVAKDPVAFTWSLWVVAANI